MKAAIMGIIALSLASPASAQSMKPMPGRANPVVKTGRGVGVITALDASKGKVTIKHGPIPSVGWPAMTMSFRATPALLRTARVGQTVAFDVRTRGMDAEVMALRSR